MINFFKKLFGQHENEEKVTCPRCLGKGHVDEADIRRLKKELIWLPGPCAYCNGKGEVKASLVAKIAVDEAYLAVDIPKHERKRFMNGNIGAKTRAKEFNQEMKSLIDEIKSLHQNGMGTSKIVEILRAKHSKIPFRKEDWLEYVKDVINHKI